MENYVTINELKNVALIVLILFTLPYLISSLSRNNTNSFLKSVVYDRDGEKHLKELETELENIPNLSQNQAQILDNYLPKIHKILFYESWSQIGKNRQNTIRLKTICKEIQRHCRFVLSK